MTSAGAVSAVHYERQDCESKTFSRPRAGAKFVPTGLTRSKVWSFRSITGQSSLVQCAESIVRCLDVFKKLAWFTSERPGKQRGDLGGVLKDQLLRLRPRSSSAAQTIAVTTVLCIDKHWLIVNPFRSPMRCHELRSVRRAV
jgi:hypothetical protein